MRKRRLSAVLAATILSLSMLVCRVLADDGVSGFTADDFDASSVIEALPDELAELLPENIEGELFEPERLLDSLDVGYFGELLLKLISLSLSPTIKIFSTLLGILVLSSAIGALKGTMRSGALAVTFELVSSLVILLTLAERMSLLFFSATECLTRLSNIMNALLPVMTAVAITGGNLTSAVVESNALLLGLCAVEYLAASGMLPILRMCFAMSAASGIGTRLRLGSITKQIREAFTWTLGLCAAAISAIMSFQTMIASRADSLSMRAVRFAASSAIPVAGGIAADAVRTVAGSLSLVRSTVGWVGVVLILLLTLPTLIEVLLTRLAFTFASSAADLLGLDRERAVLDELSGLLGSLIAVLVIASLMFVYALAVFARGAVALAGG